MTSPVPEFGEPTIASPDMARLFEAGADTVTPDHTKSRPKVPPGIKKAVGGLGGNRKARGGPRQLKDEDKAKIADFYHALAFAFIPFKPEVTDAINEEIPLNREEGTTIMRYEMCADAWFKLAQENDSVRRIILMAIEGGAWSGVFAANLPILLAALPQDAMSRMAMLIMPRMRVPDTVPDDWNGQNRNGEAPSE